MFGASFDLNNPSIAQVCFARSTQGHACADFPVVDVNCYVDAGYLEQEINDNASDGWELVTVIQPTDCCSTFFLVFKRPY